MSSKKQAKKQSKHPFDAEDFAKTVLAKNNDFKKRFKDYQEGNFTKTGLKAFIRKKWPKIITSNDKALSVIDEYGFLQPRTPKHKKKLVKSQKAPSLPNFGYNKALKQQAMDIIENEEDILEFLMYETQARVARENEPIQVIWLTIFSSILLLKALSVLLYSASSAGKSFIVRSVIECLPKWFCAVEAKNKTYSVISDIFGYVSIYNATLAAFSRLGGDNPSAIDKKIIWVHELPDKLTDSQREFLQALRQLLSEGEYQRVINTKDGNIYLDLKGWCGCIAESTDRTVEDQFGNRFILVCLDESQEQTHAIADLRTKQDMDLIVQNKSADKELIEAILHNFAVEPLFGNISNDYFSPKVTKYINLYAEITKKYFLKSYGKDPRTRRYLDYLLLAIQVITRLHYRQRKVKMKILRGKEVPVIYASAWDNAKALHLLSSIFARTYSGVTEGAMSFLKEYIEPNFVRIENDKTTDTPEFVSLPFKIADLVVISGFKRTAVYNKVRQLRESGVIFESGKDGRAKTYKLSTASTIIQPQTVITDYIALFTSKKHPSK